MKNHIEDGKHYHHRCFLVASIAGNGGHATHLLIV